MKAFIKKYHLDIALLLAFVLPGFFVLRETDPERMFIRFISSALFIFSLWLINFTLVDFNDWKQKPKRTTWILRVLLAFVLTTASYITIGFLIDHTGTMLSQVRGANYLSVPAWIFLLVRKALMNVLILIIKYTFDSNKEKRRVELENEKLKRENLAALNEVLKQQLKPHFLFNSLNTLKALVKRDPNLAEEFITKLTAVYRYMVLHQTKDVVLLKEEIDFLHSYLFLLKIRFGDAIATEINIPEEYLNSFIPPNTLQLLIENAVKHNAHSQAKPLKILLYRKDNYLAVENSLRPKDQYEESSRLGLKNIDNRYQLLFSAKIEIKKTADHFQVYLPLNLQYANSDHRG